MGIAIADLFLWFVACVDRADHLYSKLPCFFLPGIFAISKS